MVDYLSSSLPRKVDNRFTYIYIYPFFRILRRMDGACTTLRIQRIYSLRERKRELDHQTS
jgi:hypothetical protein